MMAIDFKKFNAFPRIGGGDPVVAAIARKMPDFSPHRRG